MQGSIHQYQKSIEAQFKLRAEVMAGEQMFLEYLEYNEQLKATHAELERIEASYRRKAAIERIDEITKAVLAKRRIRNEQ
mgnify:CR=1 FL=1